MYNYKKDRITLCCFSSWYVYESLMYLLLHSTIVFFFLSVLNCSFCWGHFFSFFFLLIVYECFVTITCTCKKWNKDSYTFFILVWYQWWFIHITFYLPTYRLLRYIYPCNKNGYTLLIDVNDYTTLIQELLNIIYS